jgi:hypothetical protein
MRVEGAVCSHAPQQPDIPLKLGGHHLKATETDNLHVSPTSCRRLGFPGQVHALAWGHILALVLLLIMIFHHYDGQNVWSGWVEALELRQPGYTERIYPEDVLRTRANSWSNLAYLLVGFYALALAHHD